MLLCCATITTTIIMTMIGMIITISCFKELGF